MAARSCELWSVRDYRKRKWWRELAGEDPRIATAEEMQQIMSRRHDEGTLQDFFTRAVRWDAKQPPHLYGTPLHFACFDSNKARCEGKVRLILEVACGVTEGEGGKLFWSKNEQEASDYIPLSRLLAISCPWVFQYRGKEFSVNCTPLVSLLRLGNEASLEAVRLLCHSHPEAAFELQGTVLRDLMKMLNRRFNNEFPELISITLDAANKVIQVGEDSGAEALVRRNHKSIRYATNSEKCVIMGYCSNLLSFGFDLAKWLDKKIYELSDDHVSDGKFGSMSIVTEFFSVSTVHSVAQALTYFDTSVRRGSPCLRLKKRIDMIEESEVKTEKQIKLRAAVQAAFRRVDSHTLCSVLHLVAAVDTSGEEKRRRDLSWANKHISASLNFISSEVPEAVNFVNAEGKTPLDVAIDSGKRWHDGIDFLVRSSPNCLSKRSRANGLFPFMNAAFQKNANVDLIYELLRHYPLHMLHVVN